MSSNRRQLSPSAYLDRFGDWLLQRPLTFFGLAALAGMSAYLIYASAAGVSAGFPLDDAWIHQTYARNLAQYGEFAYVPGLPSAGSTSPLWTLLLSVGYFIGIPYRTWTLLLGWLTLTGTGWSAWLLSRQLFPRRLALALAIGTLCCIEWHLVWSALSGMETPLFCTLALILLARTIGAAQSSRGSVMLGLLGGTLILTRPEGALLVALIGLDPWIRLIQRRHRVGSWTDAIKKLTLNSLALVAGCLLLLTPYLIFNLIISGSLFPNTFYAKQAEYHSIVEELSLPLRWIRVVGPTLVGSQLLLIPGLIAAVIISLRSSLRRWMGRPIAKGAVRNSLPAVYWFIFTIPYAANLPVTYQHGRYLIPTIPLLILLGAGGTAMLIGLLRNDERRRLLSIFTLLTIAVLSVAFVGLGTIGYADDVTIINGEMVAIAHWLNEHTPADALIAAHDIGAIGYFARRPLLDLAGLVTPEVIPIIRDEPALLDFIVSAGANYLVTFPSWYPQIVSSPAVEEVYQTDCARTRALGRDNMAVYRVNR